ncbi:heterokaryon incompatibility protein-domain-containing protein [Xylaria curta]|nr:heterokaryon incompatibility protein-domain-containing protein [Xylaria curta]
MRFLNTTTFELENRPQGGIHRDEYAILSHRWLDEEVIFQDLGNYTADLRSGTRSLPQVEKIRGACAVAQAKGIKLLWMDTCCIDKTDSREYSEAINSMFSWYRNAKLCITILQDVRRQDGATGKEAFRSVEGGSDEKGYLPSNWFSRGWTLQELLAPREMEIYDMDWQYIGTKRQFAGAFSDITRIDSRYITGEKDLSEASIAMKMSWLYRRETKYPEDMAYCTLGIFNVNMPLVYGEGGSRAFRRLQETILESPFMEESLFAWRMPDIHAGQECDVVTTGWQPGHWGLLAGSPQWFSESGDIQVDSDTDSQIRRFRLTPKGIEGPIRKKQTRGTAINVLSALVCISVICIPFGDCLLRPMFEEKAKEDYDFTLNCFRIGTQEKVKIRLCPVNIGKVLLTTHAADGQPVQAPYVECKRVRCDELYSGNERITHLGDGIVFQPRPRQ